VENWILAMRHVLFQKKIIYLSLLLSMFCLLINGCASSEVSRDVTAGVDLGVQNAKSLANGVSRSNVVDSYQNASQQAKGAMLGGTAGVLTGALSSVAMIPATATGALVGATYGAYIDANTTLEDQLANRDVTVVVLGDQILIVIPSARIFHAMTANIEPQAYSTLNLVSQYINQYTTMLVKVTAYTNATGPDSVNLALSQQQARSVVKYLSAAGVDARVLYATGYGGTRLVEKNSLIWDGSDNYRIEITLEKLFA
jgi:outer membrane protein OmpA-like peptidoglycan-associated protein